MSIIVNLNDTIATNDTIVVKIMKSVETCQSVINESETNCYDVGVVIAICATIFLVVRLVARVLCTWISGKNKLQMEELEQRKKMNEAECKKQDLEIELRRQEAEGEREQKKNENEYKNKKADQDVIFEKWEAEHKKAENELHRVRYQQETERIKLDAEMERKIREKDFENGKK